MHLSLAGYQPVPGWGASSRTMCAALKEQRRICFQVLLMCPPAYCCRISVVIPLSLDNGASDVPSALLVSLTLGIVYDGMCFPKNVDKVSMFLKTLHLDYLQPIPSLGQYLPRKISASAYMQDELLLLQHQGSAHETVIYLCQVKLTYSLYPNLSLRWSGKMIPHISIPHQCPSYSL